MSKTFDAATLIRILGLSPLPQEGGYFRQTFKSSMRAELLDARTGERYARSTGTAIFYLVTPDSHSAIHRVRHDEIFHFYLGDPCEMLQIDPAGSLTRLRLGNDLLGGNTIQAVVPAGNWQGLRLLSGGAWALFGTTVSPGFEFDDFELGSEEELARRFPQHRDALKPFLALPKRPGMH